MSYQKLNSITVRGYKSIKAQEIKLGDLNVLIGQNGAGKSNFISLFRLLKNIIDGRLKITSQKAGAESFLYYGSKETARIEIELNFDPNYYRLSLVPSLSDTLIIENEQPGIKREESYGSPVWETNGYAEDESRLQKKSTTSPVAGYAYNFLKDWRVYHFHDTSETAGLKKYAFVADSRFLFEDAANLAPFLYVLKRTEPAYYDRIVKTIRLVIPFFKDFILEPNRLNPENIRLEWNDIYSEKTFTTNELSDGSLRFICMATLLLQKQLPKMILLDEPELGLHPSAITILAGLLKKASKRAQVIISTQSASLVNEFDAEDIIVVEKQGAETVFKRLDPVALESWLDEYSLGELWDKNVIGGNP